ncbi:MAG: hypothetical protein K2K72_07225 [Duncaniella sp.]|nr:hypothetical protein [Duncaniella sp.]
MKSDRSIAILLLLLPIFCIGSRAQSLKDEYESFRKSAVGEYQSFRDRCNQEYVKFLREAWAKYEGKAPLPLPKDDKPVPPKPFIEDKEEKETEPVTIEPVEIVPEEEIPQPKPVAPIQEKPTPDQEYFTMDFYGVPCRIRLPEFAKSILRDCEPNSIADAWLRLSTYDTDNAIRDCLETRIRYRLCDWAYLQFLDELGKKYCKDADSAVLLTAYLYCQSGYRMRLATDGGSLVMLYGSRHYIYNVPYFDIDGDYFYPLADTSGALSICKGAFEGESPMSLLITQEQALGDQLTEPRTITSRRYGSVSATAQVPRRLIDFYNSYPTSAVDNNMMTRWAMYANTPLAAGTKELVYPALRESIKDLPEAEAANKLLNWVQTGLTYEYDDKVWGHDRAFFAEESLYYPYCDCEDRAILFSRLIRDLLGIDVALIYYPGHLATAVGFSEEVPGDAMMIDGRRFTVCDPTYIGAPVGRQMPGLEYDKTQAIILKR